MDIQPLPSTERVERVRFLGVIYRRYPQSKNISDRTYFRAGKGDVANGSGYLHRDIWVAHNGPIPDGYEVDHRDGNPFNNAIENLQLLTNAEHVEKHREGWREQSRRRAAAVAPDVRAAMLWAAAEWHRSAEGREWHSGHAKRVAMGIPLVDRACVRCGKEYRVKAHAKWSRYCSGKCRAYARKESGVDDAPRICVGCGVEFVINRYAVQRFCSLSCGRRNGSRRKASRLQPEG